MVVKYKVEGIIEVDLDKEEIRELNTKQSETMKKAYLEEVLKYKLYNCSMTAEHELDDIVDFENLHIVKDWDKYAGNMMAKNEQYGSPLAITLDDFPTTVKESSDKAMEEIAERKTHHSKKV
jgi:hypothetical protein